MPADNSMLSTLLMLAVMGLAFWLLLIRPAQRKQKAQQELVSNLGPGTRVMTTAGVMATIRELGERTAVVEISPGVEMTVLKQAIMRTVDAAEEEFEEGDGDGERIRFELYWMPLHQAHVVAGGQAALLGRIFD